MKNFFQEIKKLLYSHKQWSIAAVVFTLLAIFGCLYILNGADPNSQNNKVSDNPTLDQSSTSAKKKITDEDKPITWDNGAGVNANLAPSTPEGKAAKRVNEVGVALQAKDGVKLHSYLSEEMHAVFSAESVISAMSIVEGLTIKPTSPIEVDGEWAKQKVVGINSNGKTENYTVVLHLENGQWTLYGTTKE